MGICPLVWWVQIWDFWFQPPCLCEMQSRWTDDLSMCGYHREAWRRQCDGVSQHSAGIRHPIVFALSGTIIYFSTGQWPNIPTGCARAIWTRRRVMECCISWPGILNHPTSTQLRRFGMSWTAEWRKSSQQVLSICGNSFKTVGKVLQVKLVERMPRVCKAVIKAKGGYFEESQI